MFRPMPAVAFGVMDGYRRMPEHVEYVHRSWPADLRQLATIRQEVRTWLTPLALDDGEAADVVQAVDEAATNVVEHAYGPGDSGNVELTLWTEPGALYVEVADHGSWRPPAGGSDCRGLGIPLMHGLVHAVLIHIDARGSRVLLRHPMPSHALPSHALPTVAVE